MNLRVHRLHLDRPDDAHRHNGDAALTRQPGDAGAPLVHVGVERAGALGVQAEDVTLSEDIVAGRVQRRSGRTAPGAPDRDLPGGPEEPRRLPGVEVLRLGEEGDLAPARPAG